MLYSTALQHSSAVTQNFWYAIYRRIHTSMSHVWVCSQLKFQGSTLNVEIQLDLISTHTLVLYTQTKTTYTWCSKPLIRTDSWPACTYHMDSTSTLEWQCCTLPSTAPVMKTYWTCNNSVDSNYIPLLLPWWVKRFTAVFYLVNEAKIFVRYNCIMACIQTNKSHISQLLWAHPNFVSIKLHTAMWQ